MTRRMHGKQIRGILSVKQVESVVNQKIGLAILLRRDIFQFDKPFDPSEFVHFRKRIGASGAEKLLKLSVNLFSAHLVKEKEVLIDTTVQGKNITFPTDTNHKKIIEGCRKIAEKEGLIQ